MKQIAYYSSQTKNFKEEHLKKLVEVAVSNNQKSDITGILLYARACFFQIIEGPDEAIDTLFAKIQKDGRHHAVTKVIDEQITERSFADWSMAGLALDISLTKHDAISELSDQVINNKVTTQPHDILKILLSTFYNSSIREQV
ncbi:BLUF domain-containing protein [Pseudemcibacter aquimaris]|uniref:BLUF domain-containing protein n=1 Tax=Pseudemcibacter aquimaris TaxID=2857064 RepID=UPI0020137435|nr:BLUF domain-containing protein [Pseudemcibacter aquimaris]MCC3860563.1 BLUF domain-containing protein [Pseudemcibacter aquimaris]WDU59386.1 BLUF domain-containing protein [Pseudemcibacter aquimaris]